MQPPSARAGEARRTEGPSPGVVAGAGWWHMSSVGLVLGAGGVVGQAYHAGVLAVLEHDCGWDPRTADVIVGTSAGSITGTLLRAGVPASELAAWAVRAPLSAEGRVLHRHAGHRVARVRAVPAAGACCAGPDLPGWEMLQHAVVRPWTLPPAGRRAGAAGSGAPRHRQPARDARARWRASPGPSATCGSAPSAAATAGGWSSAGRGARRSRCTWRSPPRARCPATSPR